MAEERKTDEMDEGEKDDAVDVNEESNDSSEDDQSESEEQNESRIKELQHTLESNPYLYDTHVQLIGLLRQEGELDRLRVAREKMAEVFPLTEELWLAWLEDEEKLAGSDSKARQSVYKLFDRAVKDYFSVRIWLEYVQYSIGGMAETDGIQNIRAVFERAITAVGLHPSKGAQIWEAYHEFETAVLAGLQPAPGAVTTQERQHQQDAQTERIVKLLRRQLSIPLMDMKQTRIEYEEWSPVESHVEEAFGKALRKLKELKPYETALESADPPRLTEYQAYIDYELKQAQPARVQCIYERALQENCLIADLWLQYAKYLDRTLRIQSLCLGVHERAVRNCPWACQLWLGYILALERHSQSHDVIKETFERALGVGFEQTEDTLQLWLIYCDYLRRRINWQNEHTTELEELRTAFDRATSQFEAVQPSADPQCMILRYWARIEAKFCANMPKSRELWKRVLQRGHGSEAHMWLEFFSLERSHGNHKHCTKILQDAVNSVSDWPESLFEAYINYEREEGSLQDYDDAVVRCESQQKRVENRRAKAAEKESQFPNKQKKPGKFGKKGEKGHPPPDGSTGKPAGKWQSSAKVTFKRKAEDSAPPSEGNEGFKKPDLPSPSPTKPQSGLKPPPGYKQGSVRPPPGYQAEAPGDGGDAPQAKKSRVENMADNTGEVTPKTTSRRQACTVFVSNLDFKVNEEGLKELFSKLGDIAEVRLVKNFKGKSKGYAYVEFTDELPVTPALRLDRQPVDGRPMYVSLCQEKTASTGQSKFKYATALEKNKLFVKGLPFTITREAVETIFQQHGQVKDIRLVTHKSGKFKGLAYVEYEDETMASHAVLKTDGLVIGEHTIEVAISNPPVRKQPATAFTPSLGGGKKETADHGRARTMVSFMPRSLQKPGQGQSSAANGDPATGAKMSNADFRNMLLKK
ncbi:hypothetical protein NP493_420g02015 [Ridgeia piscesae]|uniref:RRM domain-containing protein n=1 Tax=Ridgeia piscesae TaxID=27915 RepID=A0AAD9NSL8_RIDPI|nr:hypothetical protein NP493_420g02015 [Ridgeia piscesae]